MKPKRKATTPKVVEEARTRRGPRPRQPGTVKVTVPKEGSVFAAAITALNEKQEVLAKAVKNVGVIPVGVQYHWLVVEGPGPRVGNKSTFTCRCTCGEAVVVVRAVLYQGNVRSCGCQRRSGLTPVRVDGFKSELHAARAYLDRSERERLAEQYPPRTPTVRGSELELSFGTWMH